MSFWDPWEAPHGGTLRTRALCDAFVRLGAEVSCLYPASATSIAGVVDGVERVPVAGQTVGHQRWPAPVQRLKRHLLPMPTAMGARSPALERALAERSDVDLLVVSHLTAVQYADVLPDAALWLDQSDLWSDFAAREAERRRGPARLTAGAQRRSIVEREDAAVRRAAVVTAAGWTDARTLSDRTGVEVHWLPTAVPGAEEAPLPLGTADPAIGYVANFAYHPNVDALEALIEHWLPAIRRRGWQLVVAGLQSEAMTVPDDVVVLGALDDIDDFYRRVVMTAAPVRLGGGMKVKVAESLLKGRPVIATEFAVDGFPPELRGLTHRVEVEAPALESIRVPTEPLVVPDELRRRFTPAGFADVVDAALRR